MRTIADWKEALIRLPDGPFFDLMRGYLGDIRTPFNKQRLVDELAAFLGRREHLEAVAAYLDETDRKLVAAVEMLGDPAAAELASFFDGDLAFAELHAALLNLEERLVLFRFDEEGHKRLALNPVLEPALAAAARDSAMLYPCFPAPAADEDGAAGSGAMDELFLAAVACYLRGRPDLFKADGAVRKSAAAEAAAIFGAGPFEEAVAAFAALGVAVDRGEGLEVDEGRLASLAALGAADRAAYVAAAVCAARAFPEGRRSRGLGAADAAGGGEGRAPDAEGERLARAPRDLLSSWARLFRVFLSSLDPSRRYPEATLLRLLDAAERTVAGPRRRRWEGRAVDPGAELRRGLDPAAFRRGALHALVTAGCLSESAAGLLFLPTQPDASSAPPEPPAPQAVPPRPLFSFDSTFSGHAYPGLPFADAVGLGRFMEAREAGAAVRFELTRGSAVRGFDAGLTAEGMAAELERLSGLPLPQNVRWSVREWRDRYDSVAVYRGTVLVVGTDRRYLAEAPALAALVRRELAPGVFLLSSASDEELSRALARAGADIVAFPGRSQPPPADEHRSSPFPPIASPRSAPRRAPEPAPAAAASAVPAADSDAPPPIAGASARQAALRAALDAKGLPKDQRDELASRIDRRVVLSEAQLVGAAVRYEKLEAKGLDYVGKVRVAEQALAAGSLVEIFWRGPKGEPCRALGSPLALEKGGGEVELVLEGAPRGERIRVAVGKISLLRRIKRSIFGE